MSFLHVSALGSPGCAHDVSTWAPPMQLDVAVVLQLQCNISGDGSTAGGVRASSSEINKQATTNDSCIESSGLPAFCYKERKTATEEFHDRTVVDQESVGTCCPHCV